MDVSDASEALQRGAEAWNSRGSRPSDGSFSRSGSMLDSADGLIQPAVIMTVHLVAERLFHVYSEGDGGVQTMRAGDGPGRSRTCARGFEVRRSVR